MSARKRTAGSLAALAALAACVMACGGDDDGAADGGAAGDGGDTDGGVGLVCPGMEGGWVATNVSNTPGTISHDGDVAVTAGGALHVAFAEPDPEALSDQDVWVASDTGGGWDAAEPLTSDDIQNAFPSLVSDGGTVHLVWNGRPGAEINDIFYSSNDGGGWASRVNLTAAVESGAGRHAFMPSLAVAPDGTLAVAYLSGADSELAIGPADVRVAFIEDGALTGDAETVMEQDIGCAPDAPECACDQPVAIFDGDGDLHVFAACGDSLGERMLYAGTNETGVWVVDQLPGTVGHDNGSPSAALGPGGALVVAWVSQLACDEGTCNKIQVARRSVAAFAEPTIASREDTTGDSSPTITVGDDGQLMLAFHQLNSDSYADVLFTTSDDDGATFAEPCNLTATADLDEWFPIALQVHPDTGRPLLTYEAIVPRADPEDPLNSEVFVLRLTP